jgi:hypothetical protein
MRNGAWLLLSSLFWFGCGGSVDRDGTGNAAGGSGNTGNTGNTGGGNTGGMGAHGGDAGDGGTGGVQPFCCSTFADCPQLTGQDQKSMSCVNGQCKVPPPPDQCWQDSDCQFGQCLGAGVCPCGDPLIDCIQDQLGTCMSPTPSTCCNIDMDCGDEEWVPCVNGTCKPITDEGCWKDEQCALGQKCIGASVCPCDALCAIADYPGKCE